MKKNNFETMNLSEAIKRGISDMGFLEPTPIQEAAIPIVLDNKDVIALAQTGTGKTGAFGIPIIENINTDALAVEVLILCPTRELVVQTAKQLESITKFKENVRILSIYGGQAIDRQILLLKKKPQIIVGTPGRIMDHIRRKTIKLHDIKTLVLDEADEMLDMGFREDLDTILKSSNPDRQTLLFSATMSSAIKKITKSYQKNAIVIEIEETEENTPNIKQYYLEVSSKMKDNALSKILDIEPSVLTIIFANTKRKVDEIKALLQTKGFLVDALHGDMVQKSRDTVMKSFKTKAIKVLVTTDVAARGIDAKGVDLVINYDIPSDEKYYVHRIGRTGRAGNDGRSISFITSREHTKLRNIEKYTKTKTTLYTMPTNKQIFEFKATQALKDLSLEFKKEYITKYKEFINLKSSKENIEIIDIAAALLSKLLCNIDTTEEVNFSSTNTKSTDTTRIFINIGELDSVTNTSLKKWIIENGKVPYASISSVEVFDKFSFFNVKKENTSQLLETLAGLIFNNRKVGIEISNKQASRGGSGGSRERRSNDSRERKSNDSRERRSNDSRERRSNNSRERRSNDSKPRREYQKREKK